MNSSHSFAATQQFLILITVFAGTSVVADDADAQGIFSRIRARRAVNTQQVNPRPTTPSAIPQTALPAQPKPVIVSGTTPTPATVPNPAKQGGRLGVRIRNLPNNSGVWITYVEPNSPADQTGIQVGDRIISVNGQAIPDTAKLINETSSRQPGQSIKVTYMRNSVSKTVQPTLVGGSMAEGPLSPSPTPVRPRLPENKTVEPQLDALSDDQKKDQQKDFANTQATEPSPSQASTSESSSESSIEQTENWDNEEIDVMAFGDE
ncbi:serine endoprotease [Rubripirellula obstinata]|uniref:Serine endoprotease n=1 Tax=Rubripirellula obstinata TaxID=406547 RepID=A0A5B1CPX5_9BACT|nr:PDZ domain-containing protein [Rubripirellula obstinata]KAA1262025.1 serine endoprotease [Rubripirellula obstinata]